MNKITRADKGFLSLTVSFAIFLFFTLMLSVPAGYTVGAASLLLASFYYFAREHEFGLGREDKILTWLLLAIFLVSLLSFLYHGNRVRSLDLPSRYLLAIPVLWLMLRVPPRLQFLWAGLIAGSVSGAVVAFWQTEWLGAPRAEGYTGVIQFGDLGIMMGIFCAAGLFWAQTQGQRARRGWQIMLSVGLLAGLYTSVMSGSRGGWLVVPPAVLLFCVAFLNRLNAKRAVILLIALCAAFVILVTAVRSIEVRYDLAVTEMQNYRQKDEADTSVGARLAIWRAALVMISEKPLLGWGEQDYRARLSQLVVERRADPVALALANTHNNYLELWVFQGVTGLLTVLALLVAAFRYFCCRLRSSNGTVQVLAVCGASLVMCYAVFGLTQVILGRNNTLLFFMVALTALWGGMRFEEQRLV